VATKHKARRAKPVVKCRVRTVPADQALSSSENVARIRELRMLHFPSPTGKAGRPPKRHDLYGMA
jgi:hypothetical protein